MRTRITAPREGIARLAFTLAGGGDLIGQQAGRDTTRRLSEIALRTSRERRNNAASGLDEQQFTARQGLGPAISAAGLDGGRDANAMATISNAGRAADPTVGINNMLKQFLQQNVQAGTVDPTRAAQGSFAVSGKAPFSQNSNGSVLNVGAGTVNQDNPIGNASVTALSALAGSRDAQAGASNALRDQRLAAPGKPLATSISPTLAEVETATKFMKTMMPPELADAIDENVGLVAAGQIKALTKQGMPFQQAIQEVAKRIQAQIQPGAPGFFFDGDPKFTPGGTIAELAPAVEASVPVEGGGIVDSLKSLIGFGGDTQDNDPIAASKNFSQEQLILQAKEALQAGADPAQVIERLQRMGIDPAVLGQ